MFYAEIVFSLKCPEKKYIYIYIICICKFCIGHIMYDSAVKQNLKLQVCKRFIK